ncbi:S41 family peptidase [Verrucomicrobiaceae bacterium 227]
MKKLLFWLASLGVLQADDPQWFRYPALSPDGSTIVFTHGGDLYTVPSGGGKASPLTQHVARDYAPLWSPDGATIAFASNRHGNYDVYSIAVSGGEATRLTFHSGDDLPSSFTPDGQAIVFSATRQDPVSSLEIPNRRMGELYQVPASGGRVSQLFGVPAEQVNFSPDGTRFLYHDRKGYENEWRKHHQSSVTRDIWLFNREQQSHRQISSFPGEDRNPVWLDDQQFLYLSEQSGSFNIWQSGIGKDAKPKQITTLDKHPVRFLSRSQDGKLAFSYHGSLYLMDSLEAQPRKLEITLQADDKTNVSSVQFTSDIKEIAVSPDGLEIAFISRGEIFVSSIDFNVTKRITNTPEQERSVSFHPDGRQLVYASEREGSWNLYTTSIVRGDEKTFYHATVLKEEPLLKTDDETFQPAWSPDGKSVAFLQDRVQLRKLDIDNQLVTTLLDGSQSFSYSDGDIEFAWSPDSKNILSMRLQDNRWAENLYLVPAHGQGPVLDLTQNGYYDTAPTWGWNGEGILWISNRHGRKAHGSWGSDLDIYAGFLTERAYRYFKLNEAELEEFQENQKKDDDKDKDEDTPAKLFDGPPRLTPESLIDRVERLTIHSTDLEGYALSPDGTALYYLLEDRDQHQVWVHKLYEEETKLLASLGKAKGGTPADLAINQDGTTLYVLASGKITTVETKSGDTTQHGEGGEMNLDLATERTQMFEHAWRQVREKFHRIDLHGVDWDFYGAEYRKLLPAITNNDDFAEFLSEMLGELDASHTGASHRPSHKMSDTTASLGIFDDPNYQGPGIRILEVIPRSPLDLLDRDISAGTIIEKINREPIAAGENYFARLNRLAGKRTLLSLHDLVTDEYREVIIRPISLGEEAELLYQRWMKRMTAKADQLSGGKVGWVHIRGMNDGSFREFYSRVFGQNTDKKALIVDTRFNGGGWLTEDLTTFLSGEQFLKFYPRGQKNLGGEPLFRWTKPSAVIMSEGNYSDAHLFPYAYKALEIGKLVGMPVAGTGTAVWWERLIDSSLVFGIPQVSTIDKQGRYLENTQLEPDIKVTNSPEDRAKGQDRQLEKAVEHLLSLPDPEPWPLPEDQK